MNRVLKWVVNLAKQAMTARVLTGFDLLLLLLIIGVDSYQLPSTFYYMCQNWHWASARHRNFNSFSVTGMFIWCDGYGILSYALMHV